MWHWRCWKKFSGSSDFYNFFAGNLYTIQGIRRKGDTSEMYRKRQRCLTEIKNPTGTFFIGKNLKRKDFTRKEALIMAERIKEHPILGVQEKGAPVKFTFDGKEIEGMEGERCRRIALLCRKAFRRMVGRVTRKKRGCQSGHPPKTKI